MYACFLFSNNLFLFNSINWGLQWVRIKEQAGSFPQTVWEAPSWGISRKGKPYTETGAFQNLKWQTTEYDYSITTSRRRDGRPLRRPWMRNASWVFRVLGYLLNHEMKLQFYCTKHGRWCWRHVRHLIGTFLPLLRPLVVSRHCRGQSTALSLSAETRWPLLGAKHLSFGHQSLTWPE